MHGKSQNLFSLRPLSMCAITVKLHKNYDAVKTENKRHKAHIHQNESNNFISLLLFQVLSLYFYLSHSISISISLVITGFQFQMRFNERTSEQQPANKWTNKKAHTLSHFKCRCNLRLDSIAIIERERETSVHAFLIAHHVQQSALESSLFTNSKWLWLFLNHSFGHL